MNLNNKTINISHEVNMEIKFEVRTWENGVVKMSGNCTWEDIFKVFKLEVNGNSTLTKAVLENQILNLAAHKKK